MQVYKVLSHVPVVSRDLLPFPASLNFTLPALPPLPSLFRGYIWPLFRECIVITCFTIVTCFIICVPVILGVNKRTIISTTSD